MQRFRAGDRRLLAVEPDPGARARPRRRWVCANCGVGQTDARQWLLHYGVPMASRREVFSVCPDCAHELNPVRLHLDQSAFEQVVRQRPGLRPVVELATSVVADRQLKGDDVQDVRLRAADTVALAGELGMTPPELVAELYAVGALVG